MFCDGHFKIKLLWNAPEILERAATQGNGLNLGAKIANRTRNIARVHVAGESPGLFR